MLSNFARHDIKNSIQSIDSIVSTNSPSEFTQENFNSIKLNLKIMRETIKNFSELVPHSNTGTFTYRSLINAVELLNRNNFYEQNVTLIKVNNLESGITFNLPFQSVVQMINNLIINSLKALETVVGEKLIKLSIERSDDFVIIKIFNNGEPVDTKIKDKVFQYGISTTGGSGIGLHHAEYLCKLYDGNISLSVESQDGFTKCFILNLPIISE